MQDADLDSVDDGLAEAMASRPPQEPSPGNAVAETPSNEGQKRDEQGRFAKAEAEAEAVTNDALAPKGDADPRHYIPLAEHLSEREKRQAAERRAEEFERRWAAYQAQQRQQREAEEAPQRPDPLSDPEGYEAWIDNRLTQHERSLQDKFRNDWVNLTFAQEHEANGEAFEKAMQALETARSPQIVNEIREAVNPGKALMRWYRRQTAIREVGDDIEGYQKRLRDQFKKDPEFRKEFMAELETEARGGNGSERSSTTVTPLPSVNRASGRAERQTPGALGNSDAEKFASLSAMDGRR